MTSTLKLDDDLRLSVTTDAVSVTHRLTPAEGLDLAENLTRRSFRKILEQEARLFEEEHEEVDQSYGG